MPKPSLNRSLGKTDAFSLLYALFKVASSSQIRPIIPSTSELPSLKPTQNTFQKESQSEIKDYHSKLESIPFNHSPPNSFKVDETKKITLELSIPALEKPPSPHLKKVKQFEKPKLLERESPVPVGRLERIFEFSTLGVSLASNLVAQKMKLKSLSSLDQSNQSNHSDSNFLNDETADKIVAKLSKMRGAALKLGQMLSIQDTPEMKQVASIFKRVQASADYMPQWQLEHILEHEWGLNWMDYFSEFSTVPFAAASIGQVHFAQLKETGEKVAVKIQYPGIEKSISSDLDNLYMLLSISSLLPKGLYLDNTIKVARKELSVECDYIHELEAMETFRDLIFKSNLDSYFTIPKVFKKLSSKRILVSEFVEGVTIDKCEMLTQGQRDSIGDRLLDLTLRELFEYQFMQTDPNWSNYLYNEDTEKIVLLDFGAARHFSKDFTDTYLLLLKAGSECDKDAAIKHSTTLGFLTGLESDAMKNAHVSSLFHLAKPFATLESKYNFALSNTLTSQVRQAIPIMLKERLKPPPDETYSLHRKLSGLFLLCSKLKSNIDCASRLRKYF